MKEVTEINTVNIVCVTETWLSDEIPPCINDIDGYTCQRSNRVNRRGGGVLTYIHNSIPYYRLSILECDGVEWLWLLARDKCIPRNFHIFRSAPPCACDLTTTTHIITSIDDTIKKHPHTGAMLLGDFNNLNDSQLRRFHWNRLSDYQPDALRF